MIDVLKELCSQQIIRRMKTQLPEEIIALEILARLPVKSLMRFKCVSKSWYALFRNPDFINAHHVFHTYPRLLVNGVKRGEEGMLSIFSGETLELKSYFDLRFPPSQYFGRGGEYYNVHLVSCCSINGIICLLLDFSTVFIMNPATRESKVIQRSDPNSDNIFYKDYGFGYDPITDDYKVFRLLWTIDLSLLNRFVEVYSLRSDCWRKLDAAINWRVTRGNSCLSVKGNSCTSAFVNGMIHWTACDNESCDTEILLSFDISTELFYTTVLPCQKGFTQVVRMKESIAVMNWCHVELASCWDIWILGEVGANDSWKKHVTIGPLSHRVQPIGAGENGEIFFQKGSDLESDGRMKLLSKETEVACYDPNTQMLRNLGLRMLRFASTSAVTIYSESIVSLQRNN